MTLETLNLICIIWAAIGIASFMLLQFVTAPYGRHVKKGWGPEISNKFGWIIMEAPSFFIILYFYVSSNQSAYASILSILWLVHYLNRTFIYPFRIRTKGKKMPVIIVGSAIFFNCINAGLNGYFLAHFESYDPNSFYEWNFILGLVLFMSGFVINQKNELAGIDWIFNGWGNKCAHEKDARVAAEVLALAGARRFSGPLVLEGGGIHVEVDF